METNLNNQIVTLNQENNNPVSGVTASHALITKIELESGKTTSIVTLFDCSEISFEEVNLGITKALVSGASFENYVSKEASLYALKNGALKQQITFPKVYTTQRNAS
ncbi:hypothetical protein [Flavobacterium covae]|uniref:hypothetical protein n=1 Tax=Flavobacterium covae TaxID=2906076 RepID=UPI000745E5AF|nr:hypothetical protein [Flavobacterium covae]AMA48093.1 hypothetical protein AWN65_00760 [Flavobacterium covae]MCJ1808892.1 hypothetical protein [Flavobacterium covae]